LWNRFTPLVKLKVLFGGYQILTTIDSV